MPKAELKPEIEAPHEMELVIPVCRWSIDMHGGGMIQIFSYFDTSASSVRCLGNEVTNSGTYCYPDWFLLVCVIVFRVRCSSR